MSALSDRELIAAALRGQVGAFATLIGHYRDVHTRFAVRMLGGYEAADEALQAAFVRAFQSLGKCKDADQFGDWLFRLVINECRARALRRAVRERRLTGEVDTISGTASVRANEVDAMQRVLDQVDPIIREPFILLYVEELPYPRIASLTGVGVQMLERQVDRACARLRELLPTAPPDPRAAEQVPGMLTSEPEPSLAVRVATPLQRPEVLNDSFEDRLMAKLLRSGPSAEAAAEMPEPARAASRTAAPPLPPSPYTVPSSPAPLRTYLALVGVAAGLVIAAFVAGYAARRWRDVRDVEARRPAKPAVTTKIVRRTDTVRVVREDTIVLARFTFADDAAHSVALVGDFNDWNAAATALEPAMSKGSWTVTLPLAPGRYEYAFLVDGKRWVIDRFERTKHAELGVESSVLAIGGAASLPKSGSARTRLKKVLPRDLAERVLAKLGTAADQGLPAVAVEERALEFAARRVPAKDIEQAVAAAVDRLMRAKQLLGIADRTTPTDVELIGAAEVLRRGGDSATVVNLTKSVPSRRSAAVPLEVVAELVGNEMSPPDAIERVTTRVHNGATDAALERWASDAIVRLASHPTEKGKAAKVAKRATTADVKQAGSPKPTAAPNHTRGKTSNTSKQP